jgi:hypothetical protein
VTSSAACRRPAALPAQGSANPREKLEKLRQVHGCLGSVARLRALRRDPFCSRHNEFGAQTQSAKPHREKTGSTFRLSATPPPGRHLTVLVQFGVQTHYAATQPLSVPAKWGSRSDFLTGSWHRD